MPVETDYRNNFLVGASVNGGQVAKKQRLIELLAEAAKLSADDVQLYVQGEPFTRTLYGVIGHLQRSIDSAAAQSAQPTPGGE